MSSPRGELAYAAPTSFAGPAALALGADGACAFPTAQSPDRFSVATRDDDDASWGGGHVDDSVPSIHAIDAAARRPGMYQTSSTSIWSGDADVRQLPFSRSHSSPKFRTKGQPRGGGGIDAALRQSMSAKRLATPPVRDASLAAKVWPPYHDEIGQRTGFNGSLAEVPTRCATAFQSTQSRLLIERPEGTYMGKDPRALHADGRHTGYYLNHVYDASDLVSAYRRTGILPSTAPRIDSPLTAKAVDPVVDVGLGSKRGGGKRRAGVARTGLYAFPASGTSSSTAQLGQHARKSAVFATCEGRFSPLRTYQGNDARAILADDPFDGAHTHMYQATGAQTHQCERAMRARVLTCTPPLSRAPSLDLPNGVNACVLGPCPCVGVCMLWCVHCRAPSLSCAGARRSGGYFNAGTDPLPIGIADRESVMRAEHARLVARLTGGTKTAAADGAAKDGATAARGTSMEQSTSPRRRAAQASPRASFHDDSDGFRDGVMIKQPTRVRGWHPPPC